VWVKGNNHRFAIHLPRLHFKLRNYLLVAGMYAIKSAYCYNSIAKRGQMLNVSVNLHKVRKYTPGAKNKL
jgi:hypothetical protein